MSVEIVIAGETPMTSPLVLSSSATCMVCCPDIGSVMNISVDGQPTPCAETDAHPHAIAIDPKDQGTYCCDPVQRILGKVEGNTVTPIIDQFEGRPLRGPTRLCFHGNSMFFTDGGVLGDTSLAEPQGSVFAVCNDLLVPVALNCLAHPSGITATNDGNVLYVCETLQNRVLRYVRRAGGSWIGSVFHTFSGGFGPIDVAVHPTTGNLFIARMELRETGMDGVVSEMRPTGEEVAVYSIPGGELSGIAIDAKTNAVYVTENSKCALYRFAL